ncbi:alkyl/aryl-sulfatase [Nocardiopsis aegyptia]|uniref:Alkyl sulfatase BDS1-like metallo-beta-lactamase superfamily hydrolase n=1 Tax=Nocardiopsis aegyptia TaxID=220378 RepID=A0A7Z0EHG7_9ACTN|nr:alkyl sulfatase dimerization domain-containing protein [Nocardiopsis aegyptia]NYJ32150.1 alkyl sulfatase BDS1-like metallo-beta-lactamase superfamily hydrolase [Nocardiopsis aegyptia]
MSAAQEHGPDLPPEDEQDRRDAERGFVASLDPARVTGADGRLVHDAEAYAFLEGPAPEQAHPSLWRQSRLAAQHGLFRVTEGVYQVRGLDLANMTLVEGASGVIVIDTLTTAETAAAALALYRSHRGDRPVTGVILTHPHADHFGGVDGVLADAAPGVPVIAPEGFLEHAVSENVHAGPAMARRSGFMYGTALEASPAGHLGCGLGPRLASGTIGLVEPTESVTRTGQVRVVDGVEIEFQLTPGTEAPAEMNMYLPAHRALCLAENAVHTMHNILTLRGAQVRDARQWAHYLTEAIRLFGHRTDVAFATHHWPTWGADRIERFLTGQRDLYAYLHDQTVRLINRGLTPREIAEELTLPPGLDRQWANRGYYGSLSHNVKGIYQRYLGWYDGNPAHLWEHPPVEEARRWVRLLGGIDAALAHADALLAEGDLRFAATLLGHAVFAEPEHEGARRRLAHAYTSLGHGCENATWRNAYLTGARELLHGPPPARRPGGSRLLAALSVDQLLDSLAVRIDGPAAWDLDVRVDLRLPDQDAVWHLRLANGVLVHHRDREPDPRARLTLTTTKPGLVGVLARRDLGDAEYEGDPGELRALFRVLEAPDPAFAVVTP